MTFPEDALSLLSQYGRAMTLKRRIGTGSTYNTKSVTGFSVAYKAHEIQGNIKQGDRRIRVSPLELEEWGAIKTGDILDGGAVQGAELKYEGETPVLWIVWVRG